MKQSKILARACVLGAIAAVTVVAWSRSNDSQQGRAPSQTASAPEAPTAHQRSIPVDPLQLVHAQRFHTDMPFAHQWRADRQMYDAGWVLVLSGEPELLRQHQTKDPVLYVGAQTAERVNNGDSGKLVVIVPGDIDLADAAIFLGPAALPEELWQEQIDDTVTAARNGGAVPPTAEQRGKALVAGVLEFADDYWLHRHAVDLVEKHSPNEKDLIAGWRVPLVR